MDHKQEGRLLQAMVPADNGGSNPGIPAVEQAPVPAEAPAGTELSAEIDSFFKEWCEKDRVDSILSTISRDHLVFTMGFLAGREAAEKKAGAGGNADVSRRDGGQP